MASDLPWLFHSTVDTDSALVRRFVVEHELVDRVRFRNVFYPEVQSDLLRLRGSATPALWNGERLIEGADAVLSYLATMR